MSHDHHQPEPTPAEALSPVDAAAFDALVEVGFDLSRVAADHRERASAAMNVLGLLSPATSADTELDKSTLTNVTLARVMREGRPGAASHNDAELADADAIALDAWVDAKFVVDDVAADLRPRAARHEALANLARDVRVPESSLLAERTLNRIRDVAAVELRVQQSTLAGSRWSLRRWPEIVSIAATLLLAVSVLWPVLGAVRSSAMKAACGTNLGSVATAFGQYASDHRDQMPSAVASLGSGAWWDVGAREGHSNSANLFTLARAGYARLGELACPGNAHACRDRGCGPDDRDWKSLDEISYSYQLMYGQRRPAWHDGPRRVVLADRSPVVLRAVRGLWYPGLELEASPNHRSSGQHALYSDGSAGWLATPVVGAGTADEDNIWLPKPRRIEISARVTPTPEGVQVQLTGRELPADENDVFLGP